MPHRRKSENCHNLRVCVSFPTTFDQNSVNVPLVYDYEVRLEVYALFLKYFVKNMSEKLVEMHFYLLDLFVSDVSITFRSLIIHRRRTG